MKDLVSIIDVKDHVGEEIKIGAWGCRQIRKRKIAISPTP